MRVTGCARHRSASLLVPHLGQQRHELVAAQAAHAFERSVGRAQAATRLAVQRLVAVADAGAQAPGHLDQQLVAGAVAERVVDDLEAVEVDQQQRDLVLQPAARGRAPARRATIS